MAGRPPVLHAPPSPNPPAAREARHLAYAAILIREAGVDPTKVGTEDIVYWMSRPYEELGFSEHEVTAWIDACDPPDKKPPGDPVACFRAQVRHALRPPMSLGRKLALIGAASFLGAFLATKWLK